MSVGGSAGGLLQRGVGTLFGVLEKWRMHRFVQRLRQLESPPILGLAAGPEARFKHSGNAGDVIYAWPAMRALADGHPLALRLALDVPHPHVHGVHPSGGVRLNRRMFEMLRPLLLAQPQVASCDPYEGQTIDYDLDLVREYPFPLHCGHIARWYFLTFGVSADLGRPWLQAEPDRAFADYLLIARSARYHAPLIDYSFLRRHARIAFLGVESEFNAMRCMLPQLEWHRVPDFLQMAKAIAGAQLFIGNQSFPFSLAEALKTRRILEVSPLWPNVIVEGSNAFDFCYQPQFEQIFARLTE